MRDELQHHGILGQKWGIRRYQPYPSGERVKGGKEVGAATKVQQREDNTNAKIDKKSEKTLQKKGLSDNQKKAIKVGAVAVGAVLAVYGGKKLSDRLIQKSNFERKHRTRSFKGEIKRTRYSFK